MISHVIPEAQQRALMAALGERLGFDPDKVTDLRVESGIDSTARVTWTEVRVMPATEWVAIFNAAAAAAREEP